MALEIEIMQETNSLISATPMIFLQPFFLNNENDASILGFQQMDYSETKVSVSYKNK